MMVQSGAAKTSQDEDMLFMASSLILSKEDIQSAVNLRDVIEAKADTLREQMVKATVAEINKRGWAAL